MVTFLFTDIEGSTRRWEDEAETMAGLVQDHDELFRDSIARHRGQLVKQTGDGVFAVFKNPLSALETAVETQRVFVNHDEGALRVRMGLHSGIAVPRGEDFFGNEVNRAARLMGVAHGGQIVVSATTAALLGDDLPEGVAFKELGTHRLRDLSEPIDVLQILAESFVSEFPPLNSLDGYPNNLPADVSSFIGRSEDISSIGDLLSSHRLVSLTGAGGSGKTRLALQVAADMLPEFADGAWFVDLAGLTEPELVPLTVAGTLRLTEKAGRAWIDVLKDYLVDKDILLVLDNCEHLLDSAASVSNDLLGAASRLRLLTTTREPLNVPGEVAWRVPTMDLPEETAQLSLDDILAFEAVQLFVERALAARPDLDLDDKDVPAIAEVCRRLDGLPLALELAAARVRVLSIGDIAANLGDRFTLLSGGSRTALPRHRTLEGTVAWSYELLAEDEQELFRRLSVFSGGFDLEGAMVLGGPDSLLGVASLVEKSLLSARHTRDATRYRMLETVAAFAHQRLGKDFAAARDTHLQWTAMVAGNAAQELDGKNQVEWLGRVSTELDNFRAAMQWALDGGDPALGMMVAASLHRFWYIRSVREGRRWLDLFLDVEPKAPQELEARVLFAAGSLHQSQGNYERAAELLRESSGMFEELGERRGGAYALHYLMRSVWGSIEKEELREMIDTDLAEFREVEDLVGIVITLLFDALWHLQYGSVEDIETIAELSGTAERIGSPQLLAHAAEIPAVAGWFAGDFGTSAHLLAKAAAIYLEIRNQQCAAHCLENTAGWALRSGRPVDAAVLLGGATALREDTGIPTPAFEDFLYDEILRDTKNALGSEFAIAWERGQAMSMDDALDYVVEATDQGTD